MRAIRRNIGLLSITVLLACGGGTKHPSSTSGGAGGMAGTGGTSVGGGSGGTEQGTGGRTGASGSGNAGSGGVTSSGGVSGGGNGTGSGGANTAGSSGTHGGGTGGATGGATNSGGSTGATGGATSSGGTAQGGASGTGGSAGSAGSCSTLGNDKRIFVSSAVYTGNLGGLTGADAKCQGLATAVGLCGTFKAWLSDGTGNAADRLSHATGNYVRMDGQIVASGWSGLTSGTLQNPINRTEKNQAAPLGTVKCSSGPNSPVWTGATASGIAVSNGSCSNWSSASASGTLGAAFGNADSKTAAWSGMCQLVALCDSTAALYCLEQ